MASFLSFANTLVKKYLQPEPYTVVDVRIEDYVHYDIVAREDSLILHSYTGENSKVNYEIVLHRENQAKNALSVYRSDNSEECQIYYLQLKDKLPEFIRIFPNLANVSSVQETCRHIKSYPTRNLAHICSYFGYADYFKQLHASPSSTSLLSGIINNRDETGKTPLHLAIENQRITVIQSILSLSPELDLKDDEDNNILHYAAQTNRDIISTICSAITSRSVTFLPNQTSNGDTEMVEVENSISLIHLINTKNRNNFTPLYLACVNDKPECVKELLKNGADVNGASICDHNYPRKDDSFEFTDNKLSKLNVKDMKNGGTPLHWCRSPEVIEMLIETNCNLDARNFHGDTALHIMITRINLPCVLSLLSHGANVNAIGANGNTPLHLAVKSNDISMVQAVAVFGALVDIVNSSGESSRHLAATSPRSTNMDTILYILHSVRAQRCTTKRTNCNEGCAPECSYNGVPPENSAFVRDTKLYDQILIDPIVKKAVKHKSIPNQDKSNSNSKNNKKIKLLSLDGGGIRGLILIQMLAYIENVTDKNITDLFDWIAGTSTGGILALLLSSGYSASECRQIYFRLKDKLFVGYRPYSSEMLESFLQKYLGKEKRMCDLTKPKLMVTATVANRFPPDAIFFRNYKSPNEILDHPYKQEALPNLKTTEELVWKVARASGAAPTYFSQFDCFLDGGLISNNPTLDLMSEIQNLNCANEICKNECEIADINLVVSIGTGAIPIRPIEKLNFSPLGSLTGITNFASNFTTLIKVLIEQASQANGQVVERAQAWCSMINVPYFRLNPPISEDIQMDESDNIKLVNMLWETMVYIQLHSEAFNKLTLLLE